MKRRPFPLVLVSLACALAGGPALAQTPHPDAKENLYWPPAALAADGAAQPDPFAAAPSGRTPLPRPVAVPLPPGVRHLTLARPYIVAVDGEGANAVPGAFAVTAALPADGRAIAALSLPAPQPFLPDAPPPRPPLGPFPPPFLADWYQPWLLEASPDMWSRLSEAWNADPVGVRRRFREDTGRGWPERKDAGARSDASRLAVARWARQRWGDAMAAAAQSVRREAGMRGPLVSAGTLAMALSPGAAVNHHAPVLRPRVTADADVNRYGVGFLVRLAADMGDRIPFPRLDLFGLTAPEAGWAAWWVDDAVRNGVAGLTSRFPADAAARAATAAPLAALQRPNIFLPPPSEVGILVSTDTATLEPGAWLALFRAYAGLRAAGLWPNFVSDERLASGALQPARFKLMAVPAARWTDAAVLDILEAWTARGGTLVVTDPWAFERTPDGRDNRPRARRLFGWSAAEPAADLYAGPFRIRPAAGVTVTARYPNGAVAATERAHGGGRVVAAQRPMFTPEDGAFWRDAARAAGVPSRPWLEAITAANVARITGTRAP